MAVMDNTAGRLWLAVTLTAALVAPAQAQDRPLTVFVAGAVTAPLSGTADHFTPGFGAAAGVVWNLTDQAGVRLDYSWSTLQPKTADAATIAPVRLDVGANVQYATAAFVFQGPPGRTRLYILGGGGVYRRAVTLSGGLQTLVSAVCNPWWFVCETNAVAADRIVGTHATTNLGVNIGVGLTVGPAFAEVRYHYASGPTYDTFTGQVPATGKFFPLFAGIRF